MLIKSGQTANHRRQFLCKKTLLQSQKNQKVCHCTAIDWKSEQWQGSVFDRTYLACLQTRPIYPQYMLILEHTSGHCRFITEGVDTYWHMYICLFIHSHVSTNNIEKTDITHLYTLLRGSNWLRNETEELTVFCRRNPNRQYACS